MWGGFPRVPYLEGRRRSFSGKLLPTTVDPFDSVPPVLGGTVDPDSLRRGGNEIPYWIKYRVTGSLTPVLQTGSRRPWSVLSSGKRSSRRPMAFGHRSTSPLWVAGEYWRVGPDHLPGLESLTLGAKTFLEESGGSSTVRRSDRSYGIVTSGRVRVPETPL